MWNLESDALQLCLQLLSFKNGGTLEQDNSDGKSFLADGIHYVAQEYKKGIFVYKELGTPEFLERNRILDILPWSFGGSYDNTLKGFRCVKIYYQKAENWTDFILEKNLTKYVNNTTAKKEINFSILKFPDRSKWHPQEKKHIGVYKVHSGEIIFRGGQFEGINELINASSFFVSADKLKMVIARCLNKTAALIDLYKWKDDLKRKHTGFQEHFEIETYNSTFRLLCKD